MPPSTTAHERTITESGRPPGTPLRASRVSGVGRPLRLTAAPPGGRSGRLCPGLAVWRVWCRRPQLRSWPASTRAAVRTRPRRRGSNWGDGAGGGSTWSGSAWSIRVRR